MARRHTRLSTGALALAGIAVTTVGLSAPAQAKTELVYTCETAVGPQDLTVVLDTNLPDTAQTGSTISGKVTGTVTLNANLSNAMAGFLGWDYVSGTTPATATISDGTNSQTVQTTLTTPKTHFYSADGWVTDDTPDLPLVGEEATITDAAAGTYTISAPDSFTSTFQGYGRDGAETGSPIPVPCTYKSGETVIDTVTVSDDATPPTSSTSTSSTSTSSTSTSSTSSTATTTSAPTSTDSGPETPGVVQTDDSSTPGGPSALLLGGAGLAGAGLVTVLMGRRRAAARH